MCAGATFPLDSWISEVSGASHADPLGALRALSVAALARLATDPRAQAGFEVIFLKTELTGDLAPIAGRRERERCDCLVNVERLIQQAVDAGQLPVDTDTALATQLLHAYVAGIMREWV